jgi:2-hydroxy-3-oxopropionate reductase
MAAHIVNKSPETTVRVWARRPDVAEELVAAGAEWHETPALLADGADLIIIVLPDLPEVEAVLYGADGILAGSQGDLVLVICSTSSPTGVRTLAKRLHEDSDGRIQVVDAPVSGGEDGATAGTLSIMVGGDSEPVVAATLILTACGRPVHLGPLGAGQVAKACNQMIVAATVLALGEAAVLADRSGIDVGQLFELFGGGYAASRILETRGPRMVAEDYTPSGVAKYLLKDLRYAADVAEDTGTSTALLPALRTTFEDLVRSGLGESDMAVTRRYIEERSGKSTPDVTA